MLNNDETCWSVDTALLHQMTNDAHLNPLLLQHQARDIQIVGMLLMPDPSVLSKPANSLLQFNQDTGFIIKDDKGTVPIMCTLPIGEFLNRMVRVVAEVRCTQQAGICIRIKARIVEPIMNLPHKRAARHVFQVELLQKRLKANNVKNQSSASSSTATAASLIDKSKVESKFDAVQGSIMDNLKRLDDEDTLGLTAAQLSKATELNIELIKKALITLAEDGNIYCTTDDDHYKSI